MKKMFIILLCAVFGLALAAEKDLEGKPAPDFSLKSTDGKTINLSDYKGKMVILDFWATWCPPCCKEIPHLVELQKEYKGRLQVIGLDVMEDEATVKDFMTENKINYPVCIIDETLSTLYGGIKGIPTLFIIDKQGKVIKTQVGYAEKDFFESYLK